MKMLLFCGWSLFQSLQIGLAYTALRREAVKDTPRITSVLISALASVVPLITFVLFLVVIVVGGGSNVAQLAGERGMGLWRLWAEAWPLLLFGIPLSALVLLASAISPPYPSSNWQSFFSRWCGLLSAGFALYVVVTYFPDA